MATSDEHPGRGRTRAGHLRAQKVLSAIMTTPVSFPLLVQQGQMAYQAAFDG